MARNRGQESHSEGIKAQGADGAVFIPTEDPDEEEKSTESEGVNGEEIRPRLRHELTEDDVHTIHHVSNKLHYDRILRTMQLFDSRWISPNFTAYFPTEDELHQFAVELLGRAVVIGRIQGSVTIHDRDFVAMYERTAHDDEVIVIQFILDSANNLP